MYSGINIGSGPHYAQGWFNIDSVPTDTGKQPDRLIDIFDLPDFYQREFKAAYIGHVLEHIPWNAVPAAIYAISQVVVEGGPIMVVGPCIIKAAMSNQPQTLIEAIVCDPRTADHPWAHAWTPTTELTRWAMEEAGLTNVTVLPINQIKRPQWPNPSTAGWQCAIQGFTASA